MDGFIRAQLKLPVVFKTQRLYHANDMRFLIRLLITEVQTITGKLGFFVIIVVPFWLVAKIPHIKTKLLVKLCGWWLSNPFFPHYYITIRKPTMVVGDGGGSDGRWPRKFPFVTEQTQILLWIGFKIVKWAAPGKDGGAVRW